MKQITLENVNVVIYDTTTEKRIASLGLYSFRYVLSSGNNYIISDDTNQVLIDWTNATDDNEDTFASATAFEDYLTALSRETANLGKSLKLDNMELSNTGNQVKIINTNTGEQSFMVQQRVTVQGTNKVYYKEQSDTEVQENSTNAYQSFKTHTLTAAINNQGRYVMAVDFTSITDVFIKEYRSESIADGNGDGINNLNVKIFNVTTTPDIADNYRTLAGVNIDEGWHISKRAYWKLNEQATIDAKSGQNIAAGVFAFPFADGFSFESGESYRMVISADNEFKLYGVEGAPNPFGGTQSIPYVERTYIGEQEINIVTDAAKIHSGSVDFYRDDTNTNISNSLGDSYPVNTIKAIEDNGTIKLVHVNGIKEYYKQIVHDFVTIAGQPIAGSAGDVVNALNALFTVTQGQLSTSITSPQVDATGVATTNNTYTNVVDPIGDAAYGLTNGTHGVVYSDERINEPGEYFAFSIIGKNYHGIGLFDDTTDSDGNGTSDHLAELQAGDTNRYKGNLWSMWIHPTVAAWTYYGEQNVAPTVSSGFTGLEGYYSSNALIKWQTSVEYQNLATTPVGMKVGIDNLGYLVVSYFNVVENRYIPIVKFNATLPQRNYGLYYAMGHASSQMWDAPKVHLIDEAAPVLTYYTIQSTDWKYPLFTTAEQANYYDLQNGGTGTSTAQIFPDDTSFGQWYAPDNGYTSNGATQPTNTGDVIYNVIPSETLVPDAYSNTTIEVNEGATFNIPIDPQDHNWTTTVAGDSWGTLTAGNFTGTAPQVTGDYVANPNDEYTFTVTRTLESSSQGTLTIRVINLTAPITAISGFNHVAGTTAMIDSDTMNDGSVVHVNTTVADAERFIIEKTYVQTNILPHLQAANDMYIIGLENAASDFSTLELSDFDAAIVWEYETATSHTFKFYRDGSVVQNIVINSMTDAYYDYAIEVDGTSAWLIACNVNSIMNEPSPNDGGSFSHTYEVTNIEDTAPVQIHMAALNTTGDISTTGIETITTPTAPASTNTPFTKAVDFSGSEYAKHVNNSMIYQPLQMAGLANLVPAHSTQGYTANNASSRPWATVVVFKSDGYSGNQMIWNQGEGSISGSDNIFVNVTANGTVNFGWGREGVGYNQCQILTNISPSTWYAVYVAHSGERLGGAAATASALADCFDIRTMSSADSFASLSSNLSVTANWVVTGYRMDRTVAGDFTVGGRGTGYSYRGKIASMVVHCLKAGVLMPDATEIELMITDPLKWEADYLIGNSYRRPVYLNSSTNYQKETSAGFEGTHMWLMGDGTPDVFPNINNEQRPNWLNYTYLVMTNMASNDFENVNIPGLS